MFLKMDMKRYIQVLMVMMAITIVSGILADESLIINPVAPGLVSHCLLSAINFHFCQVFYKWDRDEILLSKMLIQSWKK